MAYLFIVDDDADFAAAVRTVLQSQGHEAAIETDSDRTSTAFRAPPRRGHPRRHVSGERHGRVRGGAGHPPQFRRFAGAAADGREPVFPLGLQQQGPRSDVAAGGRVPGEARRSHASVEKVTALLGGPHSRAQRKERSAVFVWMFHRVSGILLIGLLSLQLCHGLFPGQPVEFPAGEDRRRLAHAIRR